VVLILPWELRWIGPITFVMQIFVMGINRSVRSIMQNYRDRMDYISLGVDFLMLLELCTYRPTVE